MQKYPFSAKYKFRKFLTILFVSDVYNISKNCIPMTLGKFDRRNNSLDCYHDLQEHWSDTMSL